MIASGTIRRRVGPSPIVVGDREDNGTVTGIVVHPADPNVVFVRLDRRGSGSEVASP